MSLILNKTIEEILQKQLAEAGFFSGVCSNEIDNNTEMTPSEYECLRVISQAKSGDILKLIPDYKRSTLFVCIEHYEKLEVLSTNPLSPSHIKSRCAKIYGFILDINNLNSPTVVISPINIDLSLYKKVEISSVYEFVDFHKEMCQVNIEQEKKLMKKQISHSKEVIRQQKKMLKVLRGWEKFKRENG